MTERVPIKIHASTLHVPKAMAQAWTGDPIAGSKAMRAMPVTWFGRPAALRSRWAVAVRRELCIV